MNTKHTQGPWKLVGSTTVSDADQSVGIANVSTYSIGEDEAAANARLIAAAPELLEALKDYESALIRRIIRKDGSVTLEMDFRDIESANRAAFAARAAIAKATGGAE